eukprot:gene9858-2181_t
MPTKKPSTKTPYQGDNRSYGKFKCQCGQYWESGNTWKNCFQKCKSCDNKYIKGVEISNDMGDSIPWTPLQFASACGYQDVIDFLIQNGADEKIKDKANRTAQEIADFLQKNVDVEKIPKQEKQRKKEAKEFHLFVNNPFNSFKQWSNPFDENKERFQKYKNIYQKYLRHEIEQIDLDRLLMKNLERSQNSQIIFMLNDPSKSRKNYKEKFLLEIHELKKKPTESQDLKSLKRRIRNILDQKEDQYPNEIEEILLNKTYEELFNEWVNKKSEFMEIFDEFVGFEKKTNLKMRILKMIKSGELNNINFSEFFFEIERFFNVISDYFENFTGTEPEGMKLYLENQELKSKISELEYLIDYLRGKNDQIPLDGVFLEDH